MSVEISERTIGLWFMSLNETTDFLAGLESIEEGFLLQYRFRYYKEESPWSDKDEKNGDIGAFMRELHSQRWAHMKFEKKEDAA